MELIDIIRKMLSDSAQPGYRVFRKSVLLTLLICVVLVFYRHFALKFTSLESVAVTVMLVFIVLFAIGILGGALAAGFYGSYLSEIGAQNYSSGIIIFFAEWLFALSSPLLALLLLSTLSGISGHI